MVDGKMEEVDEEQSLLGNKIFKRVLEMRTDKVPYIVFMIKGGVLYVTEKEVMYMGFVLLEF